MQPRLHWFGAMLCIVLALPSAQACDVCGCGIGGYYFGISPQLNKNLLGLRYRQAGFHSNGHHGEAPSDDFFHTTEISLRWYPAKRWQVSGFLPYGFSERGTSGGPIKMHGIGDASVLANYMLFSGNLNVFGQCAKQLVQVGGGLKLPTGASRKIHDDGTGVVNPNFQLGSGSLDFIVNLSYNIRMGDWGIQTEAGAKLNTPNRSAYRFGNRYSAQLVGFYVKKLTERTSLMAQAGLYGEHSRIDREEGRKQSDTGGQQLNGVLGMDAFFGRYSVGVQYQNPLAQNISGGLLEARPRWMVSAGYAF